MSRRIEISGAPTEFEAAAIAVIVDRLAQTEREASEKLKTRSTSSRTAWVRALGQERPGEPRDQVWPD